jgi:hypothetical protein
VYQGDREFTTQDAVPRIAWNAGLSGTLVQLAMLSIVIEDRLDRKGLKLPP